MKLGVMTVPLGSMPLKEAAEYLAGLGVQALELGAGGCPGGGNKPEGIPGRRGYGLPEKAARPHRRRFRVCGGGAHPVPGGFRMSRAVVALGSNLGERENNLQSAVQALAALPHTRILKISAIYASGSAPRYL